MKNLDILRFNKDKTMLQILSLNGDYSEEFYFMENALVYLNDYFIKNEYSSDDQGIVFTNLFQEGELMTSLEGELTLLFMVYSFREGIIPELDNHHLRNGFFLFDIPNSHFFQFVGYEKLERKEKQIPLSPQFAYKHELHDFLDFLYQGDLLNEEQEGYFIEHINTLSVFEDCFGGLQKPNWFDLGELIFQAE